MGDGSRRAGRQHGATTPAGAVTRRRVVPSVIAAALLVASTAACTEPASDATITVWFHSGQGGERDVFDEQVRAWNARGESQVVVEVVPEGDYAAAVDAAAAADGLPCLLDVDGPYVSSYVASGMLTPIDDLIDRDLVNDLLPSIVQQGSGDDGRLYALGMYDSGLGLWANRRMLDAAGVRVPTGADDPWTFEEFEQALAALQALPEVDHALDLKLNYGAGEWFTYGFLPIVWGFGGDVLGEDGTAVGTLDSPATVAAMTWLQGLVDDGYVDAEQSTDDDFHGAQSSALSWVGHWMWEPHRQALGEDLVLLPLPSFPQGRATGQGSWQWALTQACDAPEAAAAFLSHLLEPDQILATTSVNGAVPARTSALARSELYADGGPLEVYADQLRSGDARPRPRTGDYGALTTTFADAVAEIIAGADAATRLRAAAEELDDILGGRG